MRGIKRMKLREYNQKIASASKVTGIPESDLYCMSLDEVKRNKLNAYHMIKKLKRSRKWIQPNMNNSY